MRRVTRPGGPVAASQWDFADGMPMLTLYWNTVLEVETARHQIDMTFASFEDYWRPFLSNVSQASSFAGTLGDEQRSELEHRLRRKIAGAAPGGPSP